MGGEAATAIVGMALAAYLTRAGGVWLMGRVRLGPRVERLLHHLPGAVLTALVVPATLTAGPAAIPAVGVTAVLAHISGNVPLAAAAGVATWLIIWHVVPQGG
jgi:uncharacterized membrane protein